MKTRTIYKLGIVIGLGNYLLYAFTVLVWAGDALLGHTAQGHYYLATNGTFVEVSYALFLFCKWQAYTLLLTFPLGLLGACLLTAPRSEANESEYTGGLENARLPAHAP